MAVTETSATKEIEDALGACELFASWTPDQRAAAAEKCALRAFTTGELLCRKGDKGDVLFVLTDGVMEAFTTTADGDEVVLQRLDELGDYCGEQALRPDSDGRRGASVRTAAESTLVIVPRDVFLASLERDDELGRSMARKADRYARQLSLVERSTMYRTLVLFDQEQGWSRRESFADGEVVFREGEAGDKVYLVESGIARVTRAEAGQPRLLARLREGQMFGELAIVENNSRQATVTAEGPLEVISFDSAGFRRAMANHPEVSRYVKTLKTVYRLDAGVVTQFDGEFLGEPALVTVTQLDDGREVIANHNVARMLYSAAIDLPPDAPVETLRHEDPRRNILREVDLLDGRLVRVHAEGPWDELGVLHRMLLDGSSLGEKSDLAAFAETGHLVEPPRTRGPGAVLCQCLGITRGAVEEAVARGHGTLDSIAETTGASTVCGGCTPVLATLVSSGGQPVRLVEEITVAPDVRSFRFAPLAAADADLPASEDEADEPLRSGLPGQHVVVSAEIDGNWVHRPYTVSSDPDERDYREITVKREEHGFFSGWLFQPGEKGPFRLSHPKGHFWVEIDAVEPVVCIVAGIGMTPALAVARSLVQHKSKRPLHIDYSARMTGDFVYRDELDDYAARHANISVRYRCTGAGERLEAQGAAALVERYPDARFLVCGPAGFQADVVEHLKAAGVAPDRVRVEVFTPVGHAPGVAAERSPADRAIGAATAVLTLAYLAQALVGIEFGALMDLQDRFAWQIGTGLALAAFVAFQWVYPVLRLAGQARRAARLYRWHKYAGPVAPLLLYAHSTALGYALLAVLSTGFLVNTLLGVVDKTLITDMERRERYHRWWLVAHVSLSLAIVLLLGWHAWFALAYK